MTALISYIFRWFETSSDTFPLRQPDKPPSTLVPFIMHYMQPYKGLILANCILATMIALVEVFLFKTIGTIVDWLSTADRNTLWEESGVWLIAMSVLVLIVLPILKFLHNAVYRQGILGNFAMRNRWQAHRYLLRQSMTFFQDELSGRVAAKVMQTAMSVRDVVLIIAEVFLYILVYFSAAILLFASSDVRLTAPMFLWMIGYGAAVKYFVPRLRDISKEQSEHRSLVTGRVVDSYTNIGVVKMFAHAELEDAYAHEGMVDFLDVVHRQLRLSTMLNLTLISLNGALLFAVTGMAIWLWTFDAVTIGAIALATGLVLRIQGMSQWVMWDTWNLFEAIGVVQDGMETIASDHAVVDLPEATELKVSSGNIQFSNIHFNYGKVRDNIDSGIIEDLSLAIKAGEKIGLVGRSGAGKSTLVNLLLRFYDLEGGCITIDGKNILEVTQDSLRSNIGVVSQDTSLLHRSVRDNIGYGRPDANLEDIISVARRAEAEQFIEKLEDMKGRKGFDAHVGERGVKLSGGQRQRIAIARVLLKDAPILILDEATSALDSEVEAVIQENLYSMMEGKTVLAIAHRLSTIAAMDRLIIMDEGQIVEQGTHEKLLELGGLYASLWSRQSGGFLLQDETREKEIVKS